MQRRDPASGALPNPRCCPSTTPLLTGHGLTLSCLSAKMAGIVFRAATAADKVAAMQLINAAYMAEAFIKMPFAEERISEETYDACIANASEVTELLLAVDSESGAIQGTAMLNPPEGSAAGHGEGSAAAHLGFVAVDPALQSPPPAGPPDLPRHPTRPTP